MTRGGEDDGGLRLVHLRSIPEIGVLRPRERQLTRAEKSQLRAHVFRRADFSGLDLSGADLRDSWFVETSLAGCDFSAADLRGAGFLSCDIRRARFFGARLGRNNFAGSWLTGAAGLCKAERRFVTSLGGVFLQVVPGGLRDADEPR